MKRRGFTLIELLAVIVILAIIAVIAVPRILNVVEEARKGAAKSSTLGFIDAIEKQIALDELKSNSTIPKDGNAHNVSEFSSVNVSGARPTKGTITVGTNGLVTSYDVEVDGYQVTTVGGSVHNPKVSKANGSNGGSSTPSHSGPTKVEATGSDTHKGIVYLNPTDLTKKCNAENSVSTPGTKTGCMKFYVFDDSGDKYKLILDHNTTATVAYETSGTYKEYAQASIKNQVDTDTASWTSVLNPRLITAEEVASITNTTTFDGSSGTWFYLNGSGDKKQTQVSTSQGTNEYAWLFDYTNGCTSYGCQIADSSTFAYWTSSPVTDNSSRACLVNSGGDLTLRNVDNGSLYGVRPVITIQKSVFE